MCQRMTFVQPPEPSTRSGRTAIAYQRSPENSARPPAKVLNRAPRPWWRAGIPSLATKSRRVPLKSHPWIIKGTATRPRSCGPPSKNCGGRWSPTGAAGHGCRVPSFVEGPELDGRQAHQGLHGFRSNPVGGTRVLLSIRRYLQNSYIIRTGVPQARATDGQASAPKASSS